MPPQDAISVHQGENEISAVVLPSIHGPCRLESSLNSEDEKGRASSLDGFKGGGATSEI